MAVILIFQILLFIFLIITFKYKNNIWYVLCALSSIVPIIGILAIIFAIVWSYICAFDSYTGDPNLIRKNKLNKWLYAGYFE